MTKFEKIINKYAFPAENMSASGLLKGCFLSGPELKNIQSCIHNLKISDFLETKDQGGILMTEIEFNDIKNRLNQTQNDFFYILEVDSFSKLNLEKTEFKLKIPIVASWKDLNNRSGLSYEIFQRPIRKYLIALPNFTWFRFIDNESSTPFQTTYSLKN